MDIISHITGNDIRGALLLAAGVLEVATTLAAVVYHETSSPRLERRDWRAFLGCWVGAALCGAVAVVWALQPGPVGAWAVDLFFGVTISLIVCGVLAIICLLILSPRARAAFAESVAAGRGCFDFSDDDRRRRRDDDDPARGLWDRTSIYYDHSRD